MIEAVGAGVTHLKDGDRAAYCGQPPGSYSMARVMPAQTVVKLPDAISFETGAAMMLKGLTAQYLLKRTRPQDGLRAGRLHPLACRGRRRRTDRLPVGARARPEADRHRGQRREVRARAGHGAAFTINYRTEDFVARVKEITGGKGVKVVYDSIGKDTWDSSLDCLRPFGLMASFGNASGLVPPFAPVCSGRRARFT